jgi:hypothetical protein
MLTFDTQVLFDARKLGHSADLGFGLVRVQLVTDNMPPTGFLISCDYRLHMSQKIGFCASRSPDRGPDLASHDIAADDQGTAHADD